MLWVSVVNKMHQSLLQLASLQWGASRTGGFSLRTPLTLRFGEEIPEKTVKTTVITPVAPAPRPKSTKKAWHRILLISPICNLLGGISLIVGALMPASKPAAAPAVTEKTVQQGVNAAAVSNQVDAETRNQWDQVKGTLTQMGWVFTSIGSITGSINGMSLGYVYKQPGMVLASMASMMCAPLLMVDPSITLRSAMLLFGGPWLAGMGNRVKNEYSLEKGEAPREFDMAPLIDRKALEQLASGGKPMGLGGRIKSWLGHSGRMVRFVAGDQVVMVKSLATSFTQIRSKEKRKAEEEKRRNLASISGQMEQSLAQLKPSSTQNYVGAMLTYVGSVPMLFVGGSMPAVTEICTKLNALGGLCADSSLLMTAIKEKEKWLLVGIPMRVAGNAFMHTDIGTGVNLIGRVAVQNYFRKEITHGDDPKPHI